MRVTLLDSYDSFTWNLVQALGGLGAEVEVVAVDAPSVDAVWRADAVLLGPGPGRPEDAGALVPTAAALMARQIPTLGVCLGHQALALATGARVSAVRPVHGYPSPITHADRGVFQGLPSPFPAMRYHSLAVEPDSLPACLPAVAWSDDGVIQGVAHTHAPAWGVQFHPESIGTSAAGVSLLARWLALSARANHARAEQRFAGRSPER